MHSLKVCSFAIDTMYSLSNFDKKYKLTQQINLKKSRRGKMGTLLRGKMGLASALKSRNHGGNQLRLLHLQYPMKKTRPVFTAMIYIQCPLRGGCNVANAKDGHTALVLSRKKKMMMCIMSVACVSNIL